MKFLLLPITFLLLVLSSLHSQQKWRQLSTDDGLSNDVINVIYQAKNGDIWIGTDSGINRYTGIFDNFLDSTSNDPMAMIQVNLIFEAPTRQLMARVGIPISNTSTGGLVRNDSIYLFDGVEWEKPDFLADNGILGSPLPEFFVVSGDKLWMATWSHGLVGFDGQKWQFYDPDVDVNWLVKTPDGRLWTESWDLDGIASFDGQKWQLEFNTDNSLLDEPKTNTALVTSTGQILLGTDQGLFQYNPNLNTLSDLVLGKVSVNKILESRDGSIWVRAEEEKKEKRFYQRNNGKWTTVLADQGITTLYQLDNHDLWAGGTNGLFRFNGESWQLQLGRKINCIYQLADGTMLAGTDSGLWIEQVNEENNLTSAQLGLFIKAIFQDSNGTMWYRSDQGVLSYDGQAWTNHLVNPGIAPLTGIRGGIYEAPDGTIWVTPWTLDSYKDEVWKTHSLPIVWAFDVTTTNDGRLWSWGASGAAWLNKETEEWIGTIDTSSWTPWWIRGFIEGSDGRYWIGTAGSDTAYFDGNRWVRVPIVGGGEISFFEDDDHDLWAVGSGIFKWQESNQQWLEVTGDETRSAKFRTPKISADGTWRLMSDGEPIFASFDGKKLSIHPSSDQPDISYRNIHDDGFVEYPAGVFWLATDRGLRRIGGDTWYDLTVADGSRRSTQ